MDKKRAKKSKTHTPNPTPPSNHAMMKKERKETMKEIKKIHYS